MDEKKFETNQLNHFVDCYLKFCGDLSERGYFVDLHKDGDRLDIKVFRDSVSCKLWINNFSEVKYPYAEICKYINTAVESIQRYNQENRHGH